MGSLDNFRRSVGLGNSNRRMIPTSSFGGFMRPQQQAQQPQAAGRGFPERFELENPFHSVSQTSVDVFESAGRFPGQVTETLPSLIDTASRRTIGFSPLDAAGQVPGVAGFGGAVMKGLELSGNFIPAFINSADAKLIEKYGDKPDHFELPATERIEGGPLGAIPGLGMLFGRAKTVGELKRELEQRNFLVDPETGEQRSWGQTISELRGGQKSIFDYGYADINDNPLVNLGGRIVLDPTNLLFLLPGVNVAKGAATAKKVADAIDTAGDVQQILRHTPNIVPALERAGLQARKLPPPVVAKEAVAMGDVSRTTLRGVASFYKDILAYPTSASLRLATTVGRRAIDPRGYLGLTDGALTATSPLGRTAQAVGRGARGYAVSNAALSASLATTGYTAGLVDDALGGNTFFQGFHDFVLDVENNNPLSESAAWMLASAFSFPYGDIARGAKAGVARGALEAFGNDFEVALSDAFGFGKDRPGRQRFREAVGGPEAVNRMITHFVKQVVAKELQRQPLVGQKIASAPSAAMRARWSDETLAAATLTRLRGNKISGDQLVTQLKDWHAEGMGYKKRGGKGEQQLVPHELAAPWVPDLAMRRWKLYDTVQSTVGRGMQQTADGVMAVGLREYVVKEQWDEIAFRLKAAYKNHTDWKDIQYEIQSVMEDVPALAMSDARDFWKNAALPDAKPLTWRQVQGKIAKQRKGALGIDELLGEAAIKEQRAGLDDGPSGFEAIEDKIARLSDELDQHRGRDGEILDTPRAREIQSEIQEHLNREQSVAAVKRFETDEAIVGTAGAKALAELDKSVPELRLHESTMFFDAEQRAIALEVERALLELHPSYTVKALPKDQIIVQLRDTDPAIFGALQTRTLLGELVFDRGPIAPFTGFMKKALAPVRGDRQARDARQALYQATIPDGAKPSQVDAWIGLMAKDAEKFSFEMRGQRFGIYRDVTSLPASAINATAREAFGPNSKIVQKWDGRFHDLLDTASSRMWRSVRNQVRQGGKRGEFGRALEAWHEFYLDGPGMSAVSGGGRLVGKTFYNIFRFLLDPRWIMLNLAERNFLGAAQDGIWRGAKHESRATAFYASGARRSDMLSSSARETLARAQRRLDRGKITVEQFEAIRHRVSQDALQNMTSDTGWYYGRGIMSHVGRSYDVRRVDSAIETLNALGQTDAAALNTIRTRMRREAEADLAAARRAREAGEDVPNFAEIERRADLDIENSNKDLAILLDDKMYAFDQKGVRRTLDEEARAILDESELTVMQPLLDVLYQQNEALWRDVNRLYLGNPERNTIERIANSYWLYWPISYQIKALKWLSGAMLDGSFGHNNNALLAGRYAQWKEQHEERFANNPAYAAMFEENRDLWFVAQMVLPLTPMDIGITLSRPTRLAGILALEKDQEKLEDWMSDRGIHGPLTAAAYITDMGPIYTWHLMQDAEADAMSYKRFTMTSKPEAAPPTQPLTFNPSLAPSTLPAPLAPSTP